MVHRDSRQHSASVRFTRGHCFMPSDEVGLTRSSAASWPGVSFMPTCFSIIPRLKPITCELSTRWFMQHLLDGDVASNSHNWQWIAGCGTDAAPYFRVFNPV